MSELRVIPDAVRAAADEAAAAAQIRAWGEVPNPADVVAAMLATSGEDEVFLPSEALPYGAVRLYWRIAENDEGDVGLLVRAVRLSPAEAAIGKAS